MNFVLRLDRFLNYVSGDAALLIRTADKKNLNEEI